MNFVGHHEVATRAGLDAGGRLGAMLPDFATMLGVRLRRDVLTDSVADGVRLHHATDAVFHDHPPVRAGMQALGASLQAEGVGRGPSRAVGHIGYEMLLDSTLGPPDLRATLDASGTRADVAHALADHADWAIMRRRLAAGVARYDDPEWVADRLFHILARRPRLAFPPAQRNVVAVALARAIPDVRAIAPAIFTSVTAAALAATLQDLRE
jgi:hypothetical protein